MKPNDIVEAVEKSFYVTGLLTPEAVRYKSHLFLDDRVAVVLADILRCSTTLQVILACDSRGIILQSKYGTDGNDRIDPVLHEKVFPGIEYLTGGEQHGKPMPGALFGNSPREIRPDTVRGRIVYYFSTNLGSAYQNLVATVAANSGRWHGEIFFGCLTNVDPLVRCLQREGFARIVLVGAGFYETPSLEDVVWGGYVIERLRVSPHLLEDGATLMRLAAAAVRSADDRLAAFSTNRIGRALAEYKMEGDIKAVITGDGMDSDLFRKMSQVVGRVRWYGMTPVIIPDWSAAQVFASPEAASQP